MQKNKKLSPYKVILGLETNVESYRVSKKLFEELKNKLAPYRSLPNAPKAVRCIETGEIFASAGKAQYWLLRNEITENPWAYNIIKDACRKHQGAAYGYHWEFVKK